jgi:hypothetical protein
MFMSDHHSSRRAAGFSLLSVSIMIGVVMSFGLVLISYVMSSREASKSLEAGISGTQIAEAGIRKAIFCLNAASGIKCGGNYGGNYAGETNVVFGTGKFTTVLAGSGAIRTITSIGTTANSRQTKIVVDATTVPPTDETAFSYALQSGEGGAHLENNAEISGSLYANGDVDCQSTQAEIDGDVYVAKTGGIIDRRMVNYHAHADRILNSNVGGDAYYQNDPADIAGSDVTGVKYSASTTPAVENLPSIDLEFWHSSAEAGSTTYGDLSPSDNVHLGPQKIVGNLTLGNNIDVIIDGPIWVVGDIVLNNNSSLTLNSTFGANSTTILADDPDNLATKGKITVINGAKIYGSGNPKSHIMLASTNTSISDTSPALSVANNASGAIFYALSGTMRLQSNGGAKSLAAKRLFIDQNAVITYVESELSDMNFSNSPGGIWHVTEGTWREIK